MGGCGWRDPWSDGIYCGRGWQGRLVSPASLIVVLPLCGCTGILYRDMYARDLTGTHVEMRCLRELVQHKLPRLAAHMDGLSCDMSILATGEVAG